MNDLDPRDFGLNAEHLRAAANRLYEPCDQRLDKFQWNQSARVWYGLIRYHLRALADAIENQDEGDTAA